MPFRSARSSDLANFLEMAGGRVGQWPSWTEAGGVGRHAPMGVVQARGEDDLGHGVSIDDDRHAKFSWTTFTLGYSFFYLRLSKRGATMSKKPKPKSESSEGTAEVVGEIVQAVTELIRELFKHLPASALAELNLLFCKRVQMGPKLNNGERVKITTGNNARRMRVSFGGTD